LKPWSLLLELNGFFYTWTCSPPNK
jgi:hypothetical protein